MSKIYAPNQLFNGVGAGGVVFKDGVAETNNAAALMYFRDAGFGIDGPPPGPPDATPRFDARDFAEPIVLGTPLRDAAVDPKPTDFLPPTNAGEADPHGPLVVSPGLHAVGPKPIRPGDVFVDDVARQNDAETALAHAVLVEGVLATDATHLEGQPVAGSLAQSRPGDRDTKPAWVSFAVSQGMDADEAEAATKGDLIERFG